MTYTEFSDKFIPALAKLYREKKIGVHGLVDFDTWKKVFPEPIELISDFHWQRISFNAFVLDDEEKSMLIIYTLPLFNQKNEAQYIGVRLNNKRNAISLYYLRRPQFVDEFWKLYIYDFSRNKDFFIDAIKGANSMREFKKAVTEMDFDYTPTILDRLLTYIQ